MNNQEVFGAVASVNIRFDGSIQALAEKLCAILHLRDFEVELSEYPPYVDIGSAEALGWALWLEAGNTTGEFTLSGETGHAVQEMFLDRMHDLSPWLARYLAMMLELTVTPSAHDSPLS